MTAIRAAYESAHGRLCGMSYDDFQTALADWEIHPVVVAGDEIGAVLINGPQIHACILPDFKGRWVNRKLLQLLDDVLTSNGFAITSATTSDGIKFVQRLGFEQNGDHWLKRYGH